jgi:hypothetical protein
MRTMLRHALPALTLLAALATPHAMAAQAPDGISGAWITEFERSMRNDNGVVSAGEKARARLTLQRKGDSVTGTWEMLNAPGPATPRQLRGTAAGDSVALHAEFNATVNINGEESIRKIAVLYKFVLNGDRLEGTITNRSAEMDMPPRPFSAWREK